MEGMFGEASSFNQDISKWNISDAAADTCNIYGDKS